MRPTSHPASPPAWTVYSGLTLLAAALFVMRILAPPDLLDHDQERPASYVLDVVRNGHWICQRDWTGDITSKPPLWTWLSALTTLAVGRVNEFSLYLPGALSGLGTACLVLAFGRRYFGDRAALLGAVGVMLSVAGVKEMGLARTDGVFALTVTGTAFAVFTAWLTGKNWTTAWIWGAAAVLAKGPLGLILAGLGLVAVLWERRSGKPSSLLGSHYLGLFWIIVIVGGWFGLAFFGYGHPLIDKMVGKELVGHALNAGEANHFPGTLFYQPPLYYLSRGAPWSLFACIGFWRVWSRPSSENDERRFERFLFCWFLLGMAIFCFSPHQRPDLLWPLLPAGTLLAGRELARWTRNVTSPLFYGILTAASVLGVAGFTYNYFGPRTKNSLIGQTIALKQMAGEIEKSGGRDFPIEHMDDPMTLQIYLNTLRTPISPKRAAELLRGTNAAWIAVNNLAALQAARTTNDPPFYDVLDARYREEAAVRIISNRKALPRNHP